MVVNENYPTFTHSTSYAHHIRQKKFESYRPEMKFEQPGLFVYLDKPFYERAINVFGMDSINVSEPFFVPKCPFESNN